MKMQLRLKRWGGGSAGAARARLAPQQSIAARLQNAESSLLRLEEDVQRGPRSLGVLDEHMQRLQHEQEQLRQCNGVGASAELEERLLTALQEKLPQLVAASVEAAGTEAAAAAASAAVEAMCQGAIAQHVRDRHGNDRDDENQGMKHVMQELDALRRAVNDDVESAIAPVRDGLDRALREARAEQAASFEDKRMADARVNDAVVALKTKVRSLEGLANSIDEVHSQLQAIAMR